MMSSQQGKQEVLDLENTESRRLLLPSPKRLPRDTAKEGELPWGLAYAAFSQDFANVAVKELIGSRRHKILDPFVGSGTTVAAAQQSGASCIGVDLNPYSALTARTRGTQADLLEVQQILSEFESAAIRANAKPKKSANSLFALLLEKIAEKNSLDAYSLVKALCSNRDSSFDAELVALCSATYAARLLSPATRGSNPAWLHLSEEAAPSSRSVANFVTMATRIAENVVMTLRDERPDVVNANAWTQVFNSDFSNAAIRNGSVKRFLTSPPYLNRLDYVRSTLPEISRLNPHDGGSIEDLRAGMMGTTKIRKSSTNLVDNMGSDLAKVVLNQIRSHSSRASSTYYYKFFSQYFFDLERFFKWLGEKTAADSAGIIVVQDSYYKEIRIPLAEIYSEFAESEGYQCEEVKGWRKSNHIGKMSPLQRKHAPDKVLTESVLLLKRR